MFLNGGYWPVSNCPRPSASLAPDSLGAQDPLVSRNVPRRQLERAGPEGRSSRSRFPRASRMVDRNSKEGSQAFLSPERLSSGPFAAGAEGVARQSSRTVHLWRREPRGDRGGGSKSLGVLACDRVPRYIFFAAKLTKGGFPRFSRISRISHRLTLF